MKGETAVLGYQRLLRRPSAVVSFVLRVGGDAGTAWSTISRSTRQSNNNEGGRWDEKDEQTIRSQPTGQVVVGAQWMEDNPLLSEG